MNTFITLCDSRRYSNILIIAATNFKEKLDSAVIRPGRIGTHYFIGLMTKKERMDLFLKQMKQSSLIWDIQMPNKKQTFREYFNHRTINFLTADMYYYCGSLSNQLLKTPIVNNQGTFTELACSILEKYIRDQHERPNLYFNQKSNALDQNIFQILSTLKSGKYAPEKLIHSFLFLLFI